MTKDFEFSSVSSYFDKHINGQLPWYDNYINSFFIEIAQYFIQRDSTVYDIGASLGSVEAVTSDILRSRNVNFRAIENNPDMVKKYTGQKENLENCDILEFGFENFSFLSSILTLSFIHPSSRYSLFEMFKRRCKIGGAFIILEKFQNKNDIIGTLFNRITWGNKLKAKEPLKDIVNKELALSGVQYPLFDHEVKNMDLVWAYGDFKSYIYINRGDNA